jgi:hypothetical protein
MAIGIAGSSRYTLKKVSDIPGNVANLFFTVYDVFFCIWEQKWDCLSPLVPTEKPKTLRILETQEPASQNTNLSLQGQYYRSGKGG